jgi:hypothetical protein
MWCSALVPPSCWVVFNCMDTRWILIQVLPLSEKDFMDWARAIDVSLNRWRRILLWLLTELSTELGQTLCHFVSTCFFLIFWPRIVASSKLVFQGKILSCGVRLLRMVSKASNSLHPRFTMLIAGPAQSGLLDADYGRLCKGGRKRLDFGKAFFGLRSFAVRCCSLWFYDMLYDHRWISMNIDDMNSWHFLTFPKWFSKITRGSRGAPRLALPFRAKQTCRPGLWRSQGLQIWFPDNGHDKWRKREKIRKKT